MSIPLQLEETRDSEQIDAYYKFAYDCENMPEDWRENVAALRIIMELWQEPALNNVIGKARDIELS